MEAYLIKPHSYVGLTCTAFQRREVGVSGVQPSSPGQDVPLEPEPLADQQLRFRCTTGRPNISLSSFHIKVGTRRREGCGCGYQELRRVALTERQGSGGGEVEVGGGTTQETGRGWETSRPRDAEYL